jgi:LacI family transcriptional regulator
MYGVGMATMDDVARRAGVSGATVSHVLNGTRRVSDETRQRVEQAIVDTGYRQNTLARALAAGRTNTIGMSAPLVTNPFIAELVNAIEVATSTAGYTLMIGDSQDDSDRETRAVTTFLERRVDGVLIAPGTRSIETTLPLIAQSGTPLVLFDRYVDGAECDQVYAESLDSARGLADHMLDHGYRDIVVLAGTPGIRSTDQRLAGVREAFERRGTPLADDRILIANANPDDAEAALTAVLATGTRPEAVITLNNGMTIGAMRALREAGLGIPGDVALGAFDDFEWADLFSPRLTAVAQDVKTMGRTAVRMLMDRIAGATTGPEVVSIPTTLHVRDSCGCHTAP